MNLKMRMKMKLVVVLGFGVMALAGVDRASADDVILLPRPCRVLDTRLINARMTAGSTMSFRVREDAGTNQGGEAGCGVPKYATGVLVGLSVVNPSAAGYARLWPWNAPSQPLAITLLMTANENGNVVTAPITLADFNFPADVSLYSTAAADYVVDIVGYTTDCPQYDEYVAFLPPCAASCLPAGVVTSMTGDPVRTVGKCFRRLHDHGDAIGCGVDPNGVKLCGAP